MADEQQFEFDVFISYSSKDKEWVRGEFLTRIEQAGLDVNWSEPRHQPKVLRNDVGSHILHSLMFLAV